MIEYVIGGFLAGILFGAVARINPNLVFVCSVGLLGYSIGVEGGPHGFAKFLWSIDTLWTWGGFIAGFLFGYLAIDRIALWINF